MINQIIPSKFNQRERDYLNYYYVELYNQIFTAMEMVKNIWNTEFPISEEIATLLFELFGFQVPNLGYFPPATQAKIRKQYLNNITFFYRNKLKKALYYQVFNLFDIKANIYQLTTPYGAYSWVNFNRVNYDTYQEKFTEILTQWLDIEIEMNKFYTIGTDDYLMFQDLFVSIVENIDYVRFLMTKIFYHLKLVCYGTYGSGGDSMPDTDTVVNVISLPEWDNKDHHFADTGLFANDGLYADSGLEYYVSNITKYQFRLADTGNMYPTVPIDIKDSEKVIQLPISGEALITADGVQKTFALTLKTIPIKNILTSIHYTIGGALQTATISSAGVFTGPNLNAPGCTINWNTGQIQLDFTTAPDASTQILADYTPFDFYFYLNDNKFGDDITISQVCFYDDAGNMHIMVQPPFIYLAKGVNFELKLDVRYI